MSKGRPADVPWLSVVMPIHCGEQWIDAALRSIVAEVTPCGAPAGVEILVLDSSPTAASLDIVRRHVDRLDPRIHVCHDRRMWHAKTNHGVTMARAEHVCWLHQDDLWLPGRLAAVHDWIAAAPDAPLHLAPSIVVDRDGRTLGVWRCPLPADRPLWSDTVTERLLVQNFIAAPAPVFRRQAWLACGGLDEQLWYTADWDVWLKLAARGPVFYHDQVTTGFRIHDGSQTTTGSRDVADFARQMQTVLDRHLPRSGGSQTTVEHIARASLAINVALAAASAGNPGALWQAACQILRLGPTGLYSYLRDSRIVERLTPRMRARLRGAF
jgi:glycosyltransferase involved in cell wall biosynthesis